MQLRRQSLHSLLERLSVCLGDLCSYVPRWCEHVSVLADIVDRNALAETRYVQVLARTLIAAPRVVGSSNPGDIIVAKLPVHPIGHRADFARIDKQSLAATITKAPILLGAREQPKADRNRGRIEELARQCHHAIDE